MVFQDSEFSKNSSLHWKKNIWDLIIVNGFMLISALNREDQFNDIA
jgi:hypothetical protein